MRLIAIEEHFTAPTFDGMDLTRMMKSGLLPPPRMAEQSRDVGDGRIADMDAAGIDVQVLSHFGGLENVDPDVAGALVREANDYLASAVSKNPDRLAGFAALSMNDPVEAADELERAVRSLGFKGAMLTGLHDGKFLDNEFFWPVLERAQSLDVPLYLHPGEAPDAVFDAYYADLPTAAGHLLATSAWGWHVDTGLQAIRLIVNGVFEAFPRLQVIVGHDGEALPFFAARTSKKLRVAGVDLARPLEEALATNFHYTTSGMFSLPPFMDLLTTMGADRIMFAVDYPVSQTTEGSEFIMNLPISEADRAKIAHQNAEGLLGLPAAA